MITLTSLATGCTTTIEIPLGADIQKIEKGEPAPETGAFLTEGGTKKVAQTYKEKKALKKELEKSPSAWSRLWTDLAIFTVGVGTGYWLLP